MKIAIVNQPFGTIILPWTGKGGSLDIWTYEMARRLAQSCDVIVYVARGRCQKNVEYDQEVKYRFVSTAVDKWYTYMSRAVDKLGTIQEFRNLRCVLFFRNVKRPLFASSLYYLTYALQVAMDLRKERCDIAHIINFSQYVPIIRALNPRIKIVLHMQCEWLTQLDRTMVEKRLREVDLIIGCSEYITEKIRHCFPQFAERCQTIYNGVDVNHFVCKREHNMATQNEVKRLLFVGRVSPEKGVHVLLDAFKKVVEHYPKAHLEIVGSQWQLPFEFLVSMSGDDKVSDLVSFYHEYSGLSYFHHLQRQILSLDIANNVTFTGFLPHRSLINYFRDAVVFVNSSFSDAFPLPIPEAMASELPVIATRVGGITEAVVDGKTGLLVEAGDVHMLGEAMLRLLSDKDLRRSMGKHARKRAVELFSWDRAVEKLLRQYNKLCEAND